MALMKTSDDPFGVLSAWHAQRCKVNAVYNWPAPSVDEVGSTMIASIFQRRMVPAQLRALVALLWDWED